MGRTQESYNWTGNEPAAMEKIKALREAACMLSSYLQDAPSTAQEYADACCGFLRWVGKKRIPLLGSNCSGYSQPWLLRAVAISRMRAAGITRLTHLDIPCKIAGQRNHGFADAMPDGKGWVRKFLKAGQWSHGHTAFTVKGWECFACLLDGWFTYCWGLFYLCLRVGLCKRWVKA